MALSDWQPTPEQEARWELHKQSCREAHQSRMLQEALAWIRTQRNRSSALSKLEEKHGKKFTERVRGALKDQSMKSLGG